MKKCILALVAIAMASGLAWGQVIDAAEGVGSVESRFSNGRFTSDVDDYKDPAFYDPNIGNFVFLGGYGDAGVPSGKVSVGFGKTINEKAYMALFYAGEPVVASGDYHDPDTPGNPDKKITNLTAVWNSRLALMFGAANMGFRFDMILDNINEVNSTYDGKIDMRTVRGDAAIGLTWGALMGFGGEKDNFAPYLSLGFVFPDVTTVSDGAHDNYATMTAGGDLLFQGAVWFGLKDNQEMFTRLTFGIHFADSYKGDKDAIAMLYPGADKDFTEGGGVRLELYAEYQKALTFGDATVKILPNITLGLGSVSNNNTLYNYKVASNDWFSAAVGLEVGAEYKHGKIGLYSGLGFQIFEYVATYHVGGDNDYKNKDSHWRFEGLKWTDPNGYLKFGVTFTPIDNMVFGAGLSGTIPYIDPQSMVVNVPNDTIWNILGQTNLALTVSYKF